MSLHRLDTIDLKNSGSLSPIGQGIVRATSSTPEPPPVTRRTPLWSPTRALHGSSPFDSFLMWGGIDRCSLPFLFSDFPRQKKSKVGGKKRGADLETQSQALESNGPRTPLVSRRSANYIPRLLLRFDCVFPYLTSSLHPSLSHSSIPRYLSLCPVT